jgi:FxsC-like protein
MESGRLESAEPVFFLSYARPNRANAPAAPTEANRYVLKLFTELNAHLYQLVDHPPGREPGFMDRSVKGGHFWEEELVAAAGSCQVLVCLLSPRYLKSEWCATEWDIFSRRRILRRADGETAHETPIVPVLWVPVLEKLPPEIDRVTRFSPRNLPDPRFGPMYEAEGLYGVLKSDQSGAYDAIVWKLALRIQELHSQYLVEKRVPRTLGDLHRTFHRQPVTKPRSAKAHKQLYFYLSYARSAPIPGARMDTNIDYWVRTLHKDLSNAVRRLAGLSESYQVGFFDGLVPAGSDWAHVQTQALSEAEVFIPLYTPRYLDSQWAMRERESFRRRLAAASPAAEPHRHLLPLLWVPLPSTEPVSELTEALQIGEGVVAYADNGLRAMRMLSVFHDQYTEIIERIAHQIVDVASRVPIGYSHAPAVNDLPGARPEGKTPYAIAVMAPTKTERPAGAPGDSYGETSTDWRPFGAAEAMPIAVYAATMAERLGLFAHTVGISEGHRLEREWPGVLLIDPWVLEAESGRVSLRSVLGQLPGWVRPIVLLDSRHADRATALIAGVTAMFDEFGISAWTLARQVDEFVALMPSLISATRSQFLRHGPIFAPEASPDKRASLRKGIRPRTPGWEREWDD